eukprot:Opistho-2@94834
MGCGPSKVDVEAPKQAHADAPTKVSGDAPAPAAHEEPKPKSILSAAKEDGPTPSSPGGDAVADMRRQVAKKKVQNANGAVSDDLVWSARRGSMISQSEHQADEVVAKAVANAFRDGARSVHDLRGGGSRSNSSSDLRKAAGSPAGTKRTPLSSEMLV